MHAHCLGKPVEYRYGRVALTPFQITNIRSLDIGNQRQFVLRDTPLDA